MRTVKCVTNQSGWDECGEREDDGIVLSTWLQIESSLGVRQKHHNFLAILVSHEEGLRPDLDPIGVPFVASFPAKFVCKRYGWIEPVSVAIVVAKETQIAKKEVEQKALSFPELTGDGDQRNLKIRLTLK